MGYVGGYGGEVIILGRILKLVIEVCWAQKLEGGEGVLWLDGISPQRDLLLLNYHDVLREK